MPPANNNEDKRIIADEVNKILIDQFHRATLNFSDNSLETKKLCVAVLSGVLTIIAGINKDKPIGEWIPSLAISGILIPLLFYFVDAVLWFYQKRLREKMMVEVNEILKRHAIKERPPETMSDFLRCIKALFNGSQIMYYGLIGISGIILIYVKCF